MNTRSIVPALIFISLSSLSSASERMRISTTILTVSDASGIPKRAGVITKDEWTSILRACSEIKGTRGCWLPPVIASSDTKARLELKPESTKSKAFWSRRDHSSELPVTGIEYTPTLKHGGTVLSGEFTLNRSLVADDREGEGLIGGRINVFVPDGEVLTFRLGGHIFGVTVSHEE